MSRIADINGNELWIADTTLQERYGEKKDIQVVDTEVRIYSSDRELIQCLDSPLQTQADHEHKLKDSAVS